MLSNAAFRAKLTAYQDKAIRSRQGIDFAYLILPVSLKGKLYSPCRSEQPRWGAVGLQEHSRKASFRGGSSQPMQPMCWNWSQISNSKKQRRSQKDRTADAHATSKAFHDLAEVIPSP